MPDIDVDGAAARPKQVSNDEGAVTERTIPELTEADRYEKARSAGTKVPFGMTIGRVKPGGTV